MNKEIELKARVDNPEDIRKHLQNLYGEGGRVQKDDVYYLYKTAEPDGEGQPVRLRIDNCRNVVTIKKKSCSAGIEVNDEFEFEVDDGGSFIKFMQMTGAAEWITKKKTGWKYNADTPSGTAVIELCEVSSLGWFIEIEIVINEPDDKQLDAAKKQLFGILKAAGVSCEQIEARYYAELLLEKKKS